MLNDILQKLSAGEVTLIVGTIGAIGVIVGAVIGSFSSLAVAWLTRRSEERKHYRQLGVEVARAKFEQFAELTQKLANQTGNVVSMPPFDVFLIHSIKLMELLSRSDLNADKLGREIGKLQNFTDNVRAASSSR